MTDATQMKLDAERKMGNPPTSVWHPEISTLCGYVLALLARVAELEAALKPVAGVAAAYTNGPTPGGGFRSLPDHYPLTVVLPNGYDYLRLTLGDCRLAAELLKGTEQ